MYRITITGPESCGKTTLAKALALEYDATFIEEFSRKFLEKHGPEYLYEDLDRMANGHLESFNKQDNELQFVDTDFIVFKVWAEQKFGYSSPVINKLVAENHFDLHILCSPDIPWEPDVLRENPTDRHMLFEKYVETLERYRKDFIIVSGTHNNRLKNCIDAIDSL